MTRTPIAAQLTRTFGYDALRSTLNPSATVPSWAFRCVRNVVSGTIVRAVEFDVDDDGVDWAVRCTLRWNNVSGVDDRE